MHYPRTIPQPALTALLLGLLVGCSTSPHGPGRPRAVSVSITPTAATLQPGGEQQFTATVTGPSNTGVTWTANGGTLAANGNTVTYSAPADPGTYQVTAASVADPSKSASATVTVEPAKPPLTTLWTRQFGGEGFDTVHAIAAGLDGNVFVAGAAAGALSGPGMGDLEAFVRKYDPAGNIVWTRHIATVEEDEAWGLAVDAAGNAIVAGTTFGSLDTTTRGAQDAFVRKYDPDGNMLWSEQFGTSSYDLVLATAVDGAGNVILTGYTGGDLAAPNAGESDVFLRKLAP